MPRAADDQPETAPDQSGARRVRADEPITIPSQDRLERREFASTLAEDVRGSPRTSGFVIALTGSWGEGKTSVINLVESDFKARDDAVVVHFNPWLFSGTEQLVEHFFDELIGQLRETKSERLASVASALETYGRVVAPLRFLPWIGEALRTSGELAATASQSVRGTAGSARARATELRERLTALDTPIVVVVDDLDRLRHDEIIDVMRLVRLVGDFPNLVYLLAYDRDRVEEALGEGDVTRGRAYLEKIVQVSHTLPPVRDQALVDLLATNLSEVVRDLSAYKFDNDHFVNLFWAGTRELFRTARDVRRFTNVLPATLALVGDEVDLGDVLVLESLRVLVPDTFAIIVGAPEAFTTTHSIGTYDDRRDEVYKTVVQSALDAAGPHRHTLEAVLPKLFPAAERHLGGSHYGPDWLTTWRRQRRVANPDVLRIFLGRRVPPGSVAAARVEAIFRALEDPDELDALLSALEPAQLEHVLSRLRGYEREFPTNTPEIAISVLSRHGARLPDGRRGMYGFGADLELSRVIYRLLRNLEPEQVERAVRASNFSDLSRHYDVVRIVGHRENSGHRLVEESAAKQLESDLRATVLGASAEDLTIERDLVPLIGLILEDDEDGGLAQVREWADDDEFFIALVRHALMISLGNTLGEAAVRRTVQLHWPRLVHLLGADLLRRRFGEIEDSRIEHDPHDDTREAWRQGLEYLDDPEMADRDVQRWPSRSDDDDE